jgi:hypothetical protein
MIKIKMLDHKYFNVFVKIQILLISPTQKNYYKNYQICQLLLNQNQLSLIPVNKQS